MRKVEQGREQRGQEEGLYKGKIQALLPYSLLRKTN